jgi:AcrR family transcriptional regulator
MTAVSRKVQTREALLSAFGDLFVERGYEAIRVGDIIARAGVGRSTFYEHYRSKHALYAQSLERIAAHIAVIVDPSTKADDLIPLFEHFWQNRGRSRRLNNATARRELVRALARLLATRLAPSGGCRTSPEPLTVLAFALAELLVGTVTAWQAGEVGCNPTQFTRELFAVVARAAATATR